MFMHNKKISLNIVSADTLCVLFPELQYLLSTDLDLTTRPWFIDDDGGLWTRADGPIAPKDTFVKVEQPQVGQSYVFVHFDDVSFI